jgi:hypothetical protein
MPRTTTIFTAAIAAAAIAAPIAAQSVDQDVRCFIASNVFVKNEKDPAKKQLAGVASFFYLGRLDARMSVQQLAAAANAQGKLMKPADLGTTMTACAARLTEKGKALQALGQQQAGAPKPK